MGGMGGGLFCKFLFQPNWRKKTDIEILATRDDQDYVRQN